MPKNDIKKQEPTALAVLDLEELAGDGMQEVSVKDMSVPFLKILQSLSPEIAPKKAEYIKGAEAGDICNTVTGEIYKTVRVIPCYFNSVVNEWKPNRGGFVATHSAHSPIVKNATQAVDANGKVVLRSAAGNDLVDTANWYVLIETEAGWTWGVIAFTSTQLKKSRKMITQLQSISVDGSKGPYTPPFYSHVIEMSTVEESNTKGDFYNWNMQVDKLATAKDRDLFYKAKAYKEQVEQGAVQAAPPAENSDAPEVPY